MPKERVDVLAYKQGLFETREQAKRGVMRSEERRVGKECRL